MGMFKYLRIAVTALSLTACVLLVALWVQSLSRTDLLEWNITGNAGVAALSYRARADFWVGRMSVQLESDRVAFGIYYYPSRVNIHSPVRFGFEFMHNSPAPTGVASFGIKMPYWFIVLCTVVLAAAPWIKWRFSLRTLLIATALVAAVLGIIAVMS